MFDGAPEYGAGSPSVATVEAFVDVVALSLPTLLVVESLEDVLALPGDTGPPVLSRSVWISRLTVVAGLAASPKAMMIKESGEDVRKIKRSVVSSFKIRWYRRRSEGLICLGSPGKMS